MAICETGDMPSASELIDRRIHELDDWRGATLARIPPRWWRSGSGAAPRSGPTRLFNASLEGNTRRAIDLREGARHSRR